VVRIVSGHSEKAPPGYCPRPPSISRSRFDQSTLDMVLVSITRLRVRSWRFLLPFLFYALRSSRQAKHSPGNLAVSLLRESDRTFWTRTVWTTESAMKEFMLAGVHRQAMRRLLEWCDEAALIHWQQESEREPNWDEAHRKLQAEGRRSKVKYPSSAHEAFRIRPPAY
jgi:hypothetical protein